MKRIPPGGAYQWECGKCAHWNLMQDAFCRCGMSVTGASAYRVMSPLTFDEQMFFQNMAPLMLQTIGKIQESLAHIENMMMELKQKGKV